MFFHWITSVWTHSFGFHYFDILISNQCPDWFPHIKIQSQPHFHFSSLSHIRVLSNLVHSPIKLYFPSFFFFYQIGLVTTIFDIWSQSVRSQETLYHQSWLRSLERWLSCNEFIHKGHVIWKATKWKPQMSPRKIRGDYGAAKQEMVQMGSRSHELFR